MWNVVALIKEGLQWLQDRRNLRLWTESLVRKHNWSLVAMAEDFRQTAGIRSVTASSRGYIIRTEKGDGTIELIGSNNRFEEIIINAHK